MCSMNTISQTPNVNPTIQCLDTQSNTTVDIQYCLLHSYHLKQPSLNTINYAENVSYSRD